MIWKKILIVVSVIATLISVGTVSYLKLSNRKSVDFRENSGDYVVLLHGMGRMKSSMKPVEKYLFNQGYSTVNLNYPTTAESVEMLSANLSSFIDSICIDPSKKVHIVTHSLGGVVVRQFLSSDSLPEGSRIVMMSPPNKGSEVTDKLLNWAPYEWLNGPAGMQLTTDSASLPNSIEPPCCDVEIGILMGTKSNDPWFNHLFKGEHDGKVSVESAKLPFMKDFRVHPVTHTFIMKDQLVIQDIFNFIDKGQFSSDKSETALN